MGIRKIRDEADEITALLLSVQTHIGRIAQSVAAGYSDLTRDAGEHLIAADAEIAAALTARRVWRERLEAELADYLANYGLRPNTEEHPSRSNG